MNPESSITVPSQSVEKVFSISGAAALRVFLIICAAAQDGVACISVAQLAEHTRLSERTVFEALAELERVDCIARTAGGPGPHANKISVTDLIQRNIEESSPVQDIGRSTSSISEENRVVVQDEPQVILNLIACCYRVIDNIELRRAEQFVCEHFGGDVRWFAAAVNRLRNAGGVDPDCPLNFCLNVITSNAQSP